MKPAKKPATAPKQGRKIAQALREWAASQDHLNTVLILHGKRLYA